MAKPDYRSEEAAAYRALYNLNEWRGQNGLRAKQLQKKPLCERCEVRKIIEPATVVNHRVAHKGDRRLFLAPTNLESVCAPCHDGAIQSEEALGFSNDIDPETGWPTDERHPANR